MVDVSGSMSTATTIKNEHGQEESHGLSILDIVKHAVKTVINGLEPCDRVGLVTFDHDAQTRFGLTVATTANKKNLMAATEKLHPQGGTDIWVGLQAAFGMLKTDHQGRFPAILLLTDGLPNSDPLRMFPLLSFYFIFLFFLFFLYIILLEEN